MRAIGGFNPPCLHLDGLGISQGGCIMVFDFSYADLSSPEIAVPTIGHSAELVQELGPWRRIVFQGTGFPEKSRGRRRKAHGPSSRSARMETRHRSTLLCSIS
jgi:hypothetical protein